MTSWIWKENLEPLLTVRTWLAKYAPAADEFTVIRGGVELTDAEQDSWYDFEFSGANRVAFSLAQDPGTRVVHVRVDCLESSKPALQIAVEIFSRFQVVAAV